MMWACMMKKGLFFSALPAENDMFMDLGETVRFKVHAVRFNPPPTPQQQQNTSEEHQVGTLIRPYAPMEVVGDINGDGLGLVSWWGGGEAAEG